MPATACPWCGEGFERAPAAPALCPACTAKVSRPPAKLVATRVAILKAATDFVVARPDLVSDDVLALAERMEAWVTR